MIDATARLPTMRSALATVALAMGVVGTASAEGYDLNRHLSGGGGFGGADPEKKRIATSRGAYICLDVSERRTSSANQVIFTLWSEIPEPNSRLISLNFDTGRHADLFTGIAVVAQSPGLKSTVIAPKRDASSRVSNVRYVIDLPREYSGGSGRFPRGGLAPGNFIMVSATLGPGKTFATVISALNEGINEASGLRFWVAASYLLGGPPPGVGTINDDGSFGIRGVSPRCRRR
jgi:hypothetical protein